MLTFNVFELQPPDPRFDTTHAFSVNANGLVGGFINQTTGLAGTTWADPANPQSISAPSSIIYALNDNGDAVGVYGFDNTVTEHAFLFEGGALVDLVPTVPAGSDALGINNSGFVVGNFGLGGHINSPRGYVYNSVTQTAPTIIDPLPPTFLNRKGHQQERRSDGAQWESRVLICGGESPPASESCRSGPCY
jgi:hypothetical protein